MIGRMMDEGRLGLKTGSGFYDYRGRDVAAYRRDVLARTLGMLKHAGLWQPPGGDRRGGHDARHPPRLRPRAARPDALRRLRRDAGTRRRCCCCTRRRAAGANTRAVLPLLGAHRRAIAIDTAGFGDSDPVAEASIEAWAGAALDALDALGIAARACGRPPHRRRDRGRAGGACAGPRRLARALVDAVHRRGAFAAPGPSGRRSMRSTPSGDGSHLAALWQKRQPFYPARPARAAAGLRRRCA